MLEYFKLNPNCILNTEIDKEIIKNILLKKSDLDKGKLDWFNKLVKSVTWCAVIREKETGIPGIIISDFDYSEIQILEIEINKYSKYNEFYDLATIIGRYMPKPLIILVKYQDKYRIIINKPRENKKNYLFTVFDEIIITYWIISVQNKTSYHTNSRLSCIVGGFGF